jgi:hypothetical protein
MDEGPTPSQKPLPDNSQQPQKNFLSIKSTVALISQIYFCQKNLHVSGSSSAHNQGFSTFGTGMCHAGLMTTFKRDQDGRA